MLTFYVVAAVVGGVFVLLSALGGFDKEHDYDKDFDKDFDFHHGELDVDADADLDADADVDADADAEADADGELAEGGHDHGAAADHAELWLPFLSMRFWTYFLAFFGVTGLLLTYLWQEGLATALLSGGMGLACGLGMAYSTRWLKKAMTTSGAGVRDFVGAEGLVLFAVSKDQIGKVRTVVKGSELDILATTDEAGAIERGARVMIIGFEGHTARVIRATYAEPQDEEPESEAAAAQEVAGEAARRVKT